MKRNMKHRNIEIIGAGLACIRLEKSGFYGFPVRVRQIKKGVYCHENYDICYKSRQWENVISTTYVTGKTSAHKI